MARDENWPDEQDPFRDEGGFSDELQGGAPPPKKGMSGGMKLMLVLLGLGGGVMLLCCGFFGFMLRL